MRALVILIIVSLPNFSFASDDDNQGIYSTFKAYRIAIETSIESSLHYFHPDFLANHLGLLISVDGNALVHNQSVVRSRLNVGSVIKYVFDYDLQCRNEDVCLLTIYYKAKSENNLRQMQFDFKRDRNAGKLLISGIGIFTQEVENRGPMTAIDTF